VKRGAFLIVILAVPFLLFSVSEARMYQPETGRYLTPDPIGFEGGDINLYVYTRNNPVNLIDPWGLDVNICYYSDAAMGFGHVGFGFPQEPNTSGFYPTSNPFDSPGIIRPDKQKEKQCKVIESPTDKDKCMERCRERRQLMPGSYRLSNRQCTSFVRDCLNECGLSAGDYAGPRPWPFFKGLP
jgi:uncharacterized protein RhaS with RHS repeats